MQTLLKVQNYECKCVKSPYVIIRNVTGDQWKPVESNVMVNLCPLQSQKQLSHSKQSATPYRLTSVTTHHASYPLKVRTLNRSSICTCDDDIHLLWVHYCYCGLIQVCWRACWSLKGFCRAELSSVPLCSWLHRNIVHHLQVASVWEDEGRLLSYHLHSHWRSLDKEIQQWEFLRKHTLLVSGQCLPLSAGTRE